MTEQRFGDVERRVDGVVGKIDQVKDVVHAIQITTVEIKAGLEHTKDHGPRIHALEQRVPADLVQRLNNIEQHMPGLKELRKWVITGGLAALGIILTALAHLVIK